MSGARARGAGGCAPGSRESGAGSAAVRGASPPALGAVRSTGKGRGAARGVCGGGKGENPRGAAPGSGFRGAETRRSRAPVEGRGGGGEAEGDGEPGTFQAEPGRPCRMQT